MDQRETIKNIDLPVLVIAGAEDPGTTPAMNKLINSLNDLTNNSLINISLEFS